MGILNRPNSGQPSVLIALWRSLAALGPVEEDELIGLCAPPPLRTRDTNDQARRTLSTWTKLGLFDSGHGRVSLAEDYALVCTDPTVDPLCTAMGSAALRVAMRAENNGDVGDPKGDDSGGAADFSYALCWLLTQDPHDAWTYDFHDKRQTEWIHEEGPRPIQNGTRWDGLVDWAAFFGLGWKVGLSDSTFFLDPSLAITMLLKELFGEEDRLGQATFVTRLTARLPVLHNGEYRLAAEKHFPDDLRIDDTTFSIALSHAMLTLESQGEIQLHNEPDADERRFLNRGRADYRIARGNTPSVTHVSWSRRDG